MTDSLGSFSFGEMLDAAEKMGFESLEFGCGNWSAAPHLELDSLLGDAVKRSSFQDAIRRKGLRIEALNCSGNQLAPNQEGAAHQAVVEKTFRLAELLDVKTIVMMSGLPGGGPGETIPNWITTSWPPETTDILAWQWEEVAFPYWEKTVQEAKDRGVERIALENHGRQLVYNPSTLMRLRERIGPMIGMNLDPSHLFWMGGDPVSAARSLGPAVYHVHAKDVRIERGLSERDGLMDTKTIDEFAFRSWNYVALGFGHDALWWRDFFAVLAMIGYEGPVSLEMEDRSMDQYTGTAKSVDFLKTVLPRSF
jgi:sugar phosphate isomerase/epimerase